MVSTHRRGWPRATVRLTAAVVLAGIALAADPAVAGSVALVAGLAWGVLRWRSIEDRLFPPPARRTFAGQRPAEPGLLVERVHPRDVGVDGRTVVVRVVEVTFLAPRDGGVR